MFVLVSYDVSTSTSTGRRRLRRVAKTCLDYGQRVQNSVFECQVDAERWTRLRLRLLDEIDDSEDSLRFYFLGRNWRNRVEHHGTRPSLDFEGPLIA
ncbi:MAG: CRISPR-associated endonuclease Cas2 [Gemmatimonadota bacterium]